MAQEGLQNLDLVRKGQKKHLRTAGGRLAKPQVGGLEAQIGPFSMGPSLVQNF
jgi:hypothetical protein